MTVVPFVALDPDFFKLLRGFEERFPAGPPSLVECDRFEVEGDVRFGAGVIARGEWSCADRARSRTAPSSLGLDQLQRPLAARGDEDASVARVDRDAVGLAHGGQRPANARTCAESDLGEPVAGRERHPQPLARVVHGKAIGRPRERQPSDEPQPRARLEHADRSPALSATYRRPAASATTCDGP